MGHRGASFPVASPAKNSNYLIINHRNEHSQAKEELPDITKNDSAVLRADAAVWHNLRLKRNACFLAKNVRKL
jgi:hypothetical protein